MRLERMKERWCQEAAQLMEDAEARYEAPEDGESEDVDPTDCFATMDDDEGHAILTCGCVVFRSWDYQGAVRMRFCPLHENAEAMYHALDVADDFMSVVNIHSDTLTPQARGVFGPAWVEVQKAMGLVQGVDSIVAKAARENEDSLMAEAGKRLALAGKHLGILRKALADLTEWGVTYTGPRDPNSPHDLLVAARAALELKE